MKKKTDTPFEPRDDEIFITYKKSDGEERHFCMEETILAKLLIDGVLFVGDFDSGPFFENDEVKHEDITTCVWVNCSDVFAWACADDEPVLKKELPELYKMHKANKRWGSVKWACKKRNQPPQGPIIDDMKKDGVWEDWMDDLKPYKEK